MGDMPDVRKGQTDVKLNRAAFEARFRERFYDPGFEQHEALIDALAEAAWHTYDEYHKSPRKRAAGAGFADAEFELPVEWLDARQRVLDAQSRHETNETPGLLVVCASPRTDQTCPGEMSKTYRLARIACDVATAAGARADLLDLSRLTAEYGRVIYPCKSCVSTAMPLCHWPCSCYPNHALGQVNDWMNDLYPRWVEAHGIVIITPVQWYQAPSTLKLMIDRLVCADGGNPDPTSTHGKTPEEAKQLELKGWSYPRHLANRAFGLVVHGDAAGVELLTSALHGWLTDMHLIAADAGVLGRYVGYYEPYATSHQALDADDALRKETQNVVRSVLATVAAIRAGTHPALRRPEEPRPK